MKKCLITALVIMSCAHYLSAQQFPKKCLFEIMCANYSHPCDTFTRWYNPWEQSIPANDKNQKLVSIKYQVVNVYHDTLYNDDASSRRAYYQVAQLPSVFLNGIFSAFDSSTIMTRYNECVDNAFTDFSITGSYIVDNDSLYYDIDVMAISDYTDPFTVYIAATQDVFYQYSVLGSRNFTNNVRKMLPDTSNNKLPSGFTANQPVNFKGSYNYQTGTVLKGSNTFSKSPHEGHLVVFVQNDISKEVMQAEAFKAKFPQNIVKHEHLDQITVYPNPAKDYLNISFTLTNTSDVSVKISDLSGKVISQTISDSFNSGEHKIALPLHDIPNGIYRVSIVSQQGTYNIPLSIIK